MLEIIEKVYTNRSGKIQIHNAIISGEPCYCVLHAPSGHKEIIDYNKRLLNTLVKRLDTSTMSLEAKKQGYLLKFQGGGRKGISLKVFVYEKYHKLKTGSMSKRRIELKDDSLRSENILDIRSCNLYASGDERPKNAQREITIIERPSNPAEKYIAIKVSKERCEYVEYEPELYEMLSATKYCAIGYTGARACVAVHYGKTASGVKIVNLARFIQIYNQAFNRYRKRHGAVKLFIKNFAKLNDEIGFDYDVAHINSCSWINCRENIMVMTTDTNGKMNDLVKSFSGGYTMYTALDGQNFILVELCMPDGTSRYFQCKTPEVYCRWQELLLRSPLTRNLQDQYCITEEGIEGTFTPRGAKESPKRKNNTLDFWTWCDHRDKLLSIPREGFFDCDGLPEQDKIQASDLSSVIKVSRLMIHIGNSCKMQ